VETIPFIAPCAITAKRFVIISSSQAGKLRFALFVIANENNITSPVLVQLVFVHKSVNDGAVYTSFDT
jgi:hypothetical protein